uniref:Ig-like domain-containing protein n=1 Tax=Heterorhabditis bacteriophora TaxID=37862 RepID=A0A1I7WHH7_HETBA
MTLIGKSIRLHSRDKPVTITCEPVKRFSEATFRWVVLSNRTLLKSITLENCSKLIAAFTELQYLVNNPVQLSFFFKNYFITCNRFFSR